MKILCPPISEQKQITEYIDRQHQFFDELITEAQRGIELLKERRTALISDAVTGKIDVRELIPDEEALLC
jgi:type I restriction enzyme S subunit